MMVIGSYVGRFPEWLLMAPAGRQGVFKAAAVGIRGEFQMMELGNAAAMYG